jgi:alpha-galactosidase
MSITGTTDRVKALRGADYVTTAVAAQLLKRYQMDKAVIRKHGIKEVNSECGGVGGLSYALRQVALIMGIVRDMEAHCPDAWLLNSSNPLPRVITAVTRYSRIKAAGFCNNAWGAEDGYGALGRLLGRDYHDLEVVSAGLNHFPWVLAVRDRKTGTDLMPEVRALIARGDTGNGRLSAKLARQFGALPLGGDSHVGEYVPWDDECGHEHEAHHGDPAERAERRRLLEEAAAGRTAWEPLLAGGSWERPGDVIHALHTKQPLHLDMINIPNVGAIVGLPDSAVVEVPAAVSDGTIRGSRVGTLPDAVAAICLKVSAVHSLAAEAAVTGNREAVDECIRIDPAVADKAAGIAAIRELITLHADLLPAFA